MGDSDSTAASPSRGAGRGHLLHALDNHAALSLGRSNTPSADTPSHTLHASAPVPVTADPSVSAVSLNVKLPPYWAADPQVWFAQVESLFATRRITSQITKYQYVVGSLSPEFAMEIRDILLSPPADQPYDVLRERLIQRTQISEQQRLRLLLSEEELGDKKPTQFLRKLQQLLGDNSLPDNLLRELFVRRLPQHVQSVVASCASSIPITALAEMADRIMDVATPASVVHAVHAAPSTPDTTAAIAALQEQVAALTAAVGELTRHRGRSRSRGQSGTPRRGRSSSPGPCFYHRRFGNDARHCESPCTWSSGNVQASQ